MTVLPIALAAAAVLLLAIIDAGVAAAILALVLLVGVPGWVMATRTQPGASADLPARVALALGLGLTLTILVGVAVDVVGLGAIAAAVLLALGAVAGVVLMLRDGRQRLSRDALVGLPVGQIAMLALSVLITVGAFGLARATAGTGTTPELTQLWILPTATGEVEIGVHNGGNEDRGYRLVLSSDAEPLQEWAPLTLEPGATWVETVPADAGAGEELRAVLYREEEPSVPYREVVLTEPAASG